MTQALIEKENDPKLYCSVPKVITYYIYTNPHLNPYYQKILLAMIQKKNALPPPFLPNCPKYYLKRKILFF